MSLCTAETAHSWFSGRADGDMIRWRLKIRREMASRNNNTDTYDTKADSLHTSIYFSHYEDGG